MGKRVKYLILIASVLLTALCGCGRNSAAAAITDEQALRAIRTYCCTVNPNLEDIVNAEEYPVYWEISSSGEDETAVLFRSYTGAQIRYYINRTTGETYVTEYVPGITPEEQRTDESLNIRDYLEN